MSNEEKIIELLQLQTETLKWQADMLLGLRTNIEDISYRIFVIDRALDEVVKAVADIRVDSLAAYDAADLQSELFELWKDVDGMCGDVNLMRTELNGVGTDVGKLGIDLIAISTDIEDLRAEIVENREERDAGKW